MSPNRKSWIITHGISGGFLTYNQFKEVPGLSSIDECHYTHDAAIVYTYLHFKVSVPPHAINEFMARMREERHIIPFEIFGYESVATTTGEAQLIEHVGFKILIEHYTTSNPFFTSCTSGKPGVVRGLLWQFDLKTRLRETANHKSKRMGKFFQEMENELMEANKKAEMVDLMREQLMEYERKAQERDRYKFVCHVLKIRIRELDKATQDTLLAPDYKGRPLF